MDSIRHWGDDLAAPEEGHDAGLESLSALPQQGPTTPVDPPYFRPVNIVVENGLIYVNIYICQALDGTQQSQQLAIWLASLKETDVVHLTVSSLLLDVPLPLIISLLSAVATTKAKIIIKLDQIVVDNLAYFYLLADTVSQGTQGSLFIPSYMDYQREQDVSGPRKAVYDFCKWIVEDAVTKQFLTDEEAANLHRGLHVVVPMDRFT